jgi:hypothetical protein
MIRRDRGDLIKAKAKQRRVKAAALPTELEDELTKGSCARAAAAIRRPDLRVPDVRLSAALESGIVSGAAKRFESLS